MYRDNVIVGRPERKTLVANFGTTSVESTGNARGAPWPLAVQIDALE